MLRAIRDKPAFALYRHGKAIAGFDRGLAIGKTGPKPRDPNRVRGDTDYVKRRRAYKDILQEQRVAFQKDTTATVGNEMKHHGMSAEQRAAKEAKLAEKRAKSEAKQVRRKQLLEEIQAAKQVRVAHRKKDWQAKQSALAATRAGNLQLLVDHADGWITEEKLEERIEAALDEIFLPDGSMKQEAKVVGWQ